MRKHVKLSITGTESMFRTEKEVTLFLGHTIQEDVKKTVAAVKMELVKMSKRNEVTLDVESMNMDCRTTSEYRYIYRNASWRDVFELDVRKFNGYDFSDSIILNFTTHKELIKYLFAQITSHIHNFMGSLPEEESYYSMLLQENLPNELHEYISR